MQSIFPLLRLLNPREIRLNKAVDYIHNVKFITINTTPNHVAQSHNMPCHCTVHA
ncbi:hypothetical protein JCM19237_2031 [Photobacterium aphoticum]|uniref:Uncharacterized protein n=1 Tax=Photobacterium aphoticum TaxID=754436 RepID=A0A090QL58_9GAMM|nr:hypothetical protein JCM19237_2031 [Photobacterium aphoticum]